MIAPTPEELAKRADVLRQILDDVTVGRTIHLPTWDRAATPAPSEFALQHVGIEANAYGGRVGAYRYQFEGEDDLLHLFVTRQDGSELRPEDGQRVAAWLLDGVPPAYVWIKPGSRSQHFYVGHDVLLDHLVV